MKKFTFTSLFLLVCIALILSGCNEREEVDNYYLSLSGESASWNLTNYEIVLTQEEFKAGNGTLRFKNENNNMTDSFAFMTHVVVNNKDTVVHHNIISGPGTDLAELSTGAIAGPKYFNENRAPITLNEVSDIYMIVRWKDSNKNEKVEERIALYNKKEDSFLF